MKRNKEEEILPANVVGKTYEKDYNELLNSAIKEYKKRCARVIRESAQAGKKWTLVWSPMISDDILRKIIPVGVEELKAKGYKITQEYINYIKVEWE
jgi:hypothetical protein